jgi:hypothetical protein
LLPKFASIKSSLIGVCGVTFNGAFIRNLQSRVGLEFKKIVGRSFTEYVHEIEQKLVSDKL